MRVGTVTDHFAASKADYEGGDYSPEAAVRTYERNRAKLARQGTSPSHPSLTIRLERKSAATGMGSTGCVRDGPGLSRARRHLNARVCGNVA
jgi:hypothetical protein